MLWRNLTKKDSAENAKYEINKLFKVFFGRSGSGLFRIGSGFSADPDPEKTGYEAQTILQLGKCKSQS